MVATEFTIGINEICLSVNILLIVLVLLFIFIYTFFYFKYNIYYELILKICFPLSLLLGILVLFGFNPLCWWGLCYVFPSFLLFLIGYATEASLDFDKEFTPLGRFDVFMHRKNQESKHVISKIYIREFDQYNAEDITKIISNVLKYKEQLDKETEKKILDFQKQCSDVKLTYYYFADYSVRNFILPLRKLAYLGFDRPLMKKLEGNIIDFPDRVKINEKRFLDSVMIEGLKSRDLTTFIIEHKDIFQVFANLDLLEEVYEVEMDKKHLQRRLSRYKKALADAVTNNRMDNAELEGTINKPFKLSKQNILTLALFGVVVILIFFFFIFILPGVI